MNRLPRRSVYCFSNVSRLVALEGKVPFRGRAAAFSTQRKVGSSQASISTSVVRKLPRSLLRDSVAPHVLEKPTANDPSLETIAIRFSTLLQQSWVRVIALACLLVLFAVAGTRR